MLRWGRGVRMQFERSSNCHVLLYPEGCVDLNETAREILSHLPVDREALRRRLAQKYATQPHGMDEFLDEALRMKWLRRSE